MLWAPGANLIKGKNFGVTKFQSKILVHLQRVIQTLPDF